jgi:hypothetical protein
MLLLPTLYELADRWFGTGRKRRVSSIRSVEEA